MCIRDRDKVEDLSYDDVYKTGKITKTQGLMESLLNYLKKQEWACVEDYLTL